MCVCDRKCYSHGLFEDPFRPKVLIIRERFDINHIFTVTESIGRYIDMRITGVKKISVTFFQLRHGIPFDFTTGATSILVRIIVYPVPRCMALAMSRSSYISAKSSRSLNCSNVPRWWVVASLRTATLDEMGARGGAWHSNEVWCGNRP